MSNPLIFNTAQNLLSWIGCCPLLCLKNPPGCEGCEPGEIFECEQCKRLMPWCMGAADDHSELCDDCCYSNEKGDRQSGSDRLKGDLKW